MFWERFYELCLKKGTKPNPLAKELGISSGIITKWKSGSVPNGEMLVKIADHLECSIDYLMGRTDNPEINK
ncbi:MAG: helix-turn-helix transcriptional regulator [Lachnospiraceae bacterium]|nr:helix-turn-helix transcriptional regulator [Lachnospiraceae bacterium]